MSPRIRIMLTAMLITGGASFAGDAKDAWMKLVGKKFSKRPGFQFVKNDPKLPNVLIYGDSISIGYTPQVQKSLKGKANVYRLYCNGGDSGSLTRKLDQMHKVMRNKNLDGYWSFEWDVIHFNVGLHDLKYLNNRKLDKKNGKQVRGLDDYAANIEKILQYFKKIAPKAKLIFATTTPVPEGEPGRVAGDAVKYNKVALDVIKRHPEVMVNDLYAFTKPHQSTWWVKPGNVHYKSEGCAAQGNEVARLILKALGK